MELNTLSPQKLREVLFNCCGSEAWVQKMAGEFPFADTCRLLERAQDNWHACSATDWLEAFGHHPKIGDIGSLKLKYVATAAWAGGEQAAVQQASAETIEALARGNAVYEERFGFIFIVCATGKSAAEMLALLERRLSNEPAEEIRNAMIEQGRITEIRLQKLLTDEPGHNTYP